jgi:hypothetical protein
MSAPTLRELIEADPTKRFRVRISRNPDAFRDNEPGDRFPHGKATYGLPPKRKHD